MSYDRSPFQLTPWVRRLLMGLAAVYLLQLTIFTHPWLRNTFGFIPSEVLKHPWSLITYAFLHGSPLHLLGNALGLFMFGPPVEQRFGSRRFIRLYLAAVLGGALLSLAMLPLGVGGNAVVIGASAGVFGIMLAFVFEWPDAPVYMFPLPVPVKAKWLVAFLAIWSLLAAGLGMGRGVAHFAHLGGFVAAFLFLRGSSLVQRPRVRPSEERAPAVLVRPPASAGRARSAAPPSAAPGPSPEAAVRQEVDRVLDKISQGGLGSLTPEERLFLDEMSRRFKKDH